MTVCGAACGTVEPSRGIATALAGWYLISTPMHEAFGSYEAGQLSGASGSKVPQRLLVPCVIIMAINVALFLCDALMLTVAPILRRGDPNRVVPLEHHAHLQPQVFRYGDPAAGRDPGKEYSPTCVVCLADFDKGESVARLPCRHVFHTDCVTGWLQEHHACPLRCPGLALPPTEPAPTQEAPRRRRQWQAGHRDEESGTNVRGQREMLGNPMQPHAEQAPHERVSGSTADERVEHQEVVVLPFEVPTPIASGERPAAGRQESA